jgi:hypothetical protein
MPANRLLTQPSTSADNSAELDLYAAEFAKLVRRYPPSRTDFPSDWLTRLPDEAFSYYHRGTATFGRTAQSPMERRGRLYLIHTALVFMWMRWGKKTAGERFQVHAERGTRRAASLITLEHYRRGNVLARYTTPDWFLTPVQKWEIELVSAAVRTDQVPDETLRRAVRTQKLVSGTAKTLSTLRKAGALPGRAELRLEEAPERF